jgi:hypothetical protein
LEERIASTLGSVPPKLGVSALEDPTRWDSTPEWSVFFLGIYESLALRRTMFERGATIYVPFGESNPDDDGRDVRLSRAPESMLSVEAKEAGLVGHCMPVQTATRVSNAPAIVVPRETGGLVLVCALSGDRLQRAVERATADEVTAIRSLLDAGCTWLLVGARDPEGLRGALRSRLGQGSLDHFVVQGFVDDIDPYLRAGDIYLPLPRFVGGGMTARIALELGVPVIAHGSGGVDLASFLPPDAVYESFEAAADVVRLHGVDPQWRRDLSVHEKRWLIQRHGQDEVAGTLARALETATSRAVERLGHALSPTSGQSAT